MENEPFLAAQPRSLLQPRPLLQPILEDYEVSSSSCTIPRPQDPQSSSAARFGAPNTRMKKPGGLQRCKTAPAMALMRDLKPKTPLSPKPQSESSSIISKSEYVIYKLKEMGRIGDKDILQICNHFSKLDGSNSGKITLPHLLESRM